ncbi:hypothetical protein N7G274_008930 [Stereocaulon virgatum]|uniref:WD40 repeat-like protein n=1 Tax=Stereocaulon virgatum TaxID=373712 RepID=A0ABR3ZZW4_9LECA
MPSFLVLIERLEFHQDAHPSHLLRPKSSIYRNFPRENNYLRTITESPDDIQPDAAMTKHTRAARSVPGTPKRHDPSIAIEEFGTYDQHIFAFPAQHHLVVTTTRGVYTWDAHGVTEIFRSGSEGIVAAKRFTSGSEMLAVADSHVVVLHEFKSGLQRSYRLKGSEGRVRLLKYDKESKNLFFTTTLQNAVQSYSLQQSKLLDPSHSHPSPPSVFAISRNSHFLISTSVAPPTIYLTDLSRHTPPVLVRPYCSSSSVVAAAFHPDREDFFLLAFADGTAAVFDALHFFQKHGKGDRRRSDVGSGSGGEIAFIKGLHASGTSGGTPTRNADAFDGYDPGTGMVGVGGRPTGITAVAFVPGRSATAVTVGADGKCCVVDFTQVTKHKAILLQSWHVRRPATSLSIICSSQTLYSRQLDGEADAMPSKNHEEPGSAYYIAIGRQDGRVLVFDLDGTALGNQALDAGGSRVVDVEWTPIDGKVRLEAQSAFPRLSTATGKDESGRNSSLGNSNNPRAPQKHGLEPRPPDAPRMTTVEPVFDSSTPRTIPGPGRQLIEQTLESDPISSSITTSDDVTIEIDTSLASTHSPPTGSHVPRPKRRFSELSAHVAGTKYHPTVADEIIPPPIPPRPSPKPGGRLQKRRSQMAYQNPTYLGVGLEARRMSSNPRVTGVIFGPRKPPLPKIQATKTKATAPIISNAENEPEHHQIDEQESPHLMGREPPQRRAPEPPPQRTKISPPSSDSIKSYKTASSQRPSDGSDDTVVEWSVGLAQQPVPSLQTSPLKDKDLSPKAPKQKGHISLSVSSASRDTSTPGHSTSDGNTSPVASSPMRSLKQPLPVLQITHPSGEWTSKTVSKQKGHVSVPISPDTTETITPVSTSSDDQIVQWPSLKKSPRIPELSKGLLTHSPESSPETVKESITGIVLKGYTRTPSPSKPPRLRPSYVSIPPRTNTSLEEELRHCSCTTTLESILQESLTDLRAEIKQQFEVQRAWFESVVKGQEEERHLLAVENRWLQNELARVEKEKGLVGVDELGRKIRDV